MTQTSQLRTATADDVVARLTGTPYATTAVPALGWGMGGAQLAIDDAVDAAIADGRVEVAAVRDTTYGRAVRFVRLRPTTKRPMHTEADRAWIHAAAQTVEARKTGTATPRPQVPQR
jgi:hypothetical protein